MYICRIPLKSALRVGSRFLREFYEQLGDPSIRRVSPVSSVAKASTEFRSLLTQRITSIAYLISTRNSLPGKRIFVFVGFCQIPTTNCVFLLYTMPTTQSCMGLIKYSNIISKLCIVMNYQLFYIFIEK